MLCWIIGQPLKKILASQNSDPETPLTWTDYLGVLLWGIGFTFESVGDYQLAAFKQNPQNRGQLLTSGLWKYSRHPNYFGNACLFWGFYFLSCGVRGGWKTVYSPLLMTFLLLRVSGVSLLEKSLKKSKPGFQRYMQTTSSFFPWFPARIPL